MLERDIERKVCRDAKVKLGVHNIKCNGRGQTGWPDRLFLIRHGRPVFIEFKRKDGKLTEKQKIMGELLTKAGYPVHRCDDYQEAINLLSHYNEMATP